VTPVQTGRPQVLVVAWDRFQARTSVLGPVLGGESIYIHGDWPSRRRAALPLRYLADTARMWRRRRHYRPRVLVVISPPVVAPLVGVLWCLLHRCRLVVDVHTGAFHSWKWRWTVPIHRVLFRRADAVLLHTEEDESRVRGWGAPALLLPDDLPELSQAALLPPPGAPRVVLAGSFDGNEPVAESLAAAAMLPEMEVHLTGDVGRLSPAVRATAPPNAVLTGFLPYAQFLGDVLTADVVAVFSTDPHIMNRAAFEAIGLGRPLVLTDFAGLRGRFGQAALFCANDPAAMAKTLRRAYRERVALAERSQALGQRLRNQREAALLELRAMLEGLQPTARPMPRAPSPS
jgi:glycosyltransferase involved in cell wall biosynthesis